MLARVDRVQIAVRDREAAAQQLQRLFDAEIVADDAIEPLAARRRTVRAGAAEFELLEPTGPGAVAEFLGRWGEGLFAAGFATPSLDALARQLETAGLAYTPAGGQLLLDGSGTAGMRAVISADGRAEPTPGSVIRWLYEVTMLVPDAAAATALYARLFGLDVGNFCPIASEGYGYHGSLTLFDPPHRLDRIEVVQTNDDVHPMGRYYARRGASLYMCFVEVDDVDLLTRRLDDAGARYAASEYGGENGVFIHPSGLLGMLMGVSRTSFGWTWSGRPELVEAR